MQFRSKPHGDFVTEVLNLARRHQILDFIVVDNILDLAWFGTALPRLAAADYDLRPSGTLTVPAGSGACVGYRECVRYFNTAGPCVPERHYMLSPEARLPRARSLAERGFYFVVHAPRQTGKTTTMTALTRQLTAEGKRVALRFSCERGEPWGDDIAAVELAVLDSIRQAAGVLLPAEFRPPDPWPTASPGSRVHEGLMDWAVACPLSLVLVFDEIDALQGESLKSMLRQLRDGFSYKAQAFPDSIVLCGMRDLRDYRIASGAAPASQRTASPFNVSVKSLRIGDFTLKEVTELYAQHTAETGQEFTSDAVQRAFGYTQGQPWLVNALANEIIEEMGIEPPEPITAAHMDTAKERLILGRATHLDSLAAKLHEPRVRQVIEPILAGTYPDNDAAFDENARYLKDLGLLAQGTGIQVANPIYREVIVRVLGAGVESVLPVAAPHRFVLPDGRLDFRAVLDAFADIWPEHEQILRGFDYHEAGMQVMFMMFLQRIVNGGGFIDREYAVGSGRIDLLIRKPYGDGQVQREAIELKVWHPRDTNPLKEGLKQLDRYLDRLGLNTGTLVIFDRRPHADPAHERTSITHVASPAGHDITLLRA
jgi:hypothetical protein